jgi:hypothetical protein
MDRKMTKVLMCDPPSGWKYGFPKPLPMDVHKKNNTMAQSLRSLSVGFTVEWLVSEGYPQSEIDACGDHFYCRYWEVEEEEDRKKMDVTDADKKMNTTAYKRMKAGDPRYNDKTTKTKVKEAKDTHFPDVNRVEVIDEDK